MKKEDLSLALVFLADGLIWLKSGWEKVVSGKFVDSLAVTLGKFAQGNPYQWFKDFLVNMAVPNSQILGWGVELGEVFAGIMILASAAAVLSGQKTSPLFKITLKLGFLIGALLSGVFWLAAGWTSSSTDGLNLVMFVVELAGLVYWWK